MMIKSFADREIERVWNGEFSSKLPNEIQSIARRKLRMLNNSQAINDLRIPPANRIEKLKGNSKEFHSIRVNKQWRIIFRWANNNAEQVKIEDYHG
jgi:proteic killer suppression protein